MSYNGPPPPYSEATAVPKPNTGMIPGHIMQTPLGPIEPHVEQIKPAPGEFLSAMVNPYASPKQPPNPTTNASYSSDAKVPYSQASQLESGPYPGGTLRYSSNVGSGASYQSPPNSNIGNGAPPRYQSMPSPQMPMPIQAPLGAGVTPGGIYPSVGYAQQPPYPTDTFERGMHRSGAPPGSQMPRPNPSNYNRSPSPPLAGRIDQMNINGPPNNSNNYPSGPRSYSPYSPNPVYPPNIGGGASYQSPPNSIPGSRAPYRNSPSPMIGGGVSRGYSNPPMGHGTSPGYSSPMIGSGTRGYSPPRSGFPSSGPYPTPYNTPISSNFPPSGPRIGSGVSIIGSGVPMIGSGPRIGSGVSIIGSGGPMIGSGVTGGYGSGVGVGYGSGSCTSSPSSHGGYCSQYRSSNYCSEKRKNSSSSSSSSSTDSSISAHHSHHHHHC
uniref:Uncharacterized protein n=2 Tax=Panagrolaimus sp. ES5 TaxID=591445 RepID=A0AC34FJ08_9BILA